jgi:hypothetical protein
MGKKSSNGSKKESDSTPFSNPVRDTDSVDEEQGGGSVQTGLRGSSAPSVSWRDVVAAIAIIMSLIAIAITPGSDDFVDKADYDALKADYGALKATVVALQSQATDIAVHPKSPASDVASVRRQLQSKGNLNCKVVDFCAQTGLASLQSQVDELDAAPTAAEMAAVQAQMDALPSGADVTALQTQVTQLMGAHFICANGYGGADCTRDLTPPELTCPPGTISVSLAVGAAVTSAMIPRPSTLSDTGPGPASVLTVLLTPNDGDVFSSSSTPDGAAQWASPDHPFTFSASTAVGPD